MICLVTTQRIHRVFAAMLPYSYKIMQCTSTVGLQPDNESDVPQDIYTITRDHRCCISVVTHEVVY